MNMSFSLLTKLHVNTLSSQLSQISKRSISTTCYSQLLRKQQFHRTPRIRIAFFRNYSSANAIPKMAKDGKNIVLKRYDILNKPAQDTREYRGLDLSNGVRVLLISDPTTDKSAAALDVNVGHLMDPWELPGLAHFCEHMLFLGTAKYPSENEYSKYLSANAGSSNAYTASDHTNYHFDVKPEKLPGALDRFSQFFLSPQFTESATEREVCAVDSEHSNNLNNDVWRTMQVDRSRSKLGHDYGKFGTGNKKTLWEDAKEKGIEPREALLEFHKKWYSSNTMCLCVIGKESLDELESYLGTYDFAAIEDKKVDRKEWTDSPYGPDQLKKRVEVVPIKDNRFLQIAFPFPDLRPMYESQPEHYASHLLGHEGPGSLLSELKRRGWVSSLSSGYHAQARGFGVFEVSVDLSPEGLEHTEEIVELVFNYIGMIERAGAQKWIHDELRELGATKFRFKDKENPINLASTIAAELQYTPVEDVLSHKYLMNKYDPDQIMDVLRRLTPANMHYRVVAKKFAGQEGNTKEPVYGTEMRVLDIPEGTIERFEKARKTQHEALRMPEKNEYIATKFDLKPRESVKSDHPRLISENGWCRVWFKQDDEFKMPKSETQISVTNPMVSQDPLKSVLSSIWLWCLSDTLAEETYNANLAGLKWELGSGPSGVAMRVSGYDEKQALFVKHLVERMSNFKIDPTRFEVLFEALRRALSNFSHSQPYSLTQHFAQLLLADKLWSKEQLLAVCQNVTLNDVQEFTNEMFKSFHIEMLIHGNATEKEALELSKNVTEILSKVTKNSRPLYWNEYTPKREYSLDNKDEYVYRHYQNTHDVSCVEVVYQIGVQNNRDNALMGLLEFIIREPAFNTLRTNEALGYIVWTGKRLSSGTVSLSVLVQGPKGSDHVLERVEAFIEKTRSDLENMPEDEFKEQVEGMITQLEEKPKTLKQRFRRFWQEIEGKQYNFTRREDEVKVLKSITKKDLLELFDRKLAPDAPERKKLAVIVHSKSETKEKIADLIKNKPSDKKEKEIQHTEELRETKALFGRPPTKIPVRPIGVDPLSTEKDAGSKSHL